MYDQRNFMIFNIGELDAINFNEILETGQETVRKSVDGTKTFVKWDGENVPSSVENLTTKEGPYSYSEMLEILNRSDWTSTTNSVLSI